MNRYMLFLILIGLQANIASAWPNLDWTPIDVKKRILGLFKAKETVQAEPYYRWPKETKAASEKLNSWIDYHIDDNLSKQERTNITRLKEDVCNEQLRKFMNQLDRIDPKIMDFDGGIGYQEEACLRGFVKAKKLSKYKNYSPEEAATLTKRAESKLDTKLNSPGSNQGRLAYLVKGSIGEDVFKNAEKFCDEEREFLYKAHISENNHIIKQTFNDKFNKVFNKNPNAIPVENLCNEYLQNFLGGLPPHNSYATKVKKAEIAGAECVAKCIQQETENDYYASNSKNYSETTRDVLGKRAYQKAYDDFLLKNQLGFSNLLKKPVSSQALKRTKTSLYKRLGIKTTEE